MQNVIWAQNTTTVTHFVKMSLISVNLMWIMEIMEKIMELSADQMYNIVLHL